MYDGEKGKREVILLKGLLSIVYLTTRQRMLSAVKIVP